MAVEEVVLRGEYYSPMPATLISTNRSGSTFLLNCLDSHPQIGCERAEPLNPHGVWQKTLTGVPRQALMRVLWRRPGYRVSMFKMSYKQMRWLGTDLFEEEGVTLIHLNRENVLRMGVSAVINTAAVRGQLVHPTHTFAPGAAARIKIEVRTFIEKSLLHIEKVRVMKQRLRALGLPLLFLTYEDLVGLEGQEVEALMPQTGEAICRHLGVEAMPLVSYTRRVNPQPLSEIVENWAELAAALGGTALERFLEAEKIMENG